jgi:succinate dehydrogenase/fumarate reductase flavoprotein subunit
MSTQDWDKTVDAVVIGSGAGGMAAALTAHFEGLEVLLIEKTDRIGGSTAISGGAIWIPLNSGARNTDYADSPEAVRQYLDEIVGASAPDQMKHAFLENGPRMLEYMARHGALNLVARSYSPDYYSDRPGASLGGRSLDPAAFDGRELGKQFAQLRDPLNEFLVLGGMMITTTDVAHLLAATRKPRSFWYSGKLVLRYWWDRLRGYHRGTRLVLGNALAAQLFHALLRRKIEYWLHSPAQSLLRNAEGRVTGVSVQHDGKTMAIQARKGVVIATGGFPWDQELRDALYPQPTEMWSLAPQGNRGEGIRMARDAGAVMGKDHVSPAFWAPVSLWRKPDGTVIRYPHLVWDRAKPGLIAVNGNGVRFVNESASYHDFVTAMYESNKTAPSIPCYLICDHDFIEKWGLGLALPGGRPRQHLIDAGYLIQAATLDELADKIKVDGSALAQTVQRYNTLVGQGADSDFGKGGTAYNRYLGDAAHQPNPCLGEVAKPPYYAVQVVAGDIGTACGIQTNPQAQALSADGHVIPGLFVAGNDMQSVMGGAYPAPGITLGPALTFGWIAGQQLGKS